MKIMLLADCNSTHSLKWVKGLAAESHQVLIASLADPVHNELDGIVGVRLVSFGFKSKRQKLSYLLILARLRKLLKEFQPDLLHAHYASSYGLLGALMGFQPYLVSVWGSDVFSFPRKSPLHRRVFKFVMQRAGKVLSTSRVMADEILRYCSKVPLVTPFGVDTEIFKPAAAGPDVIVIGAVKALESIYGQGFLIEAFRDLRQLNPGTPMRLLLVGEGSQKAALLKRVHELGISADVEFTGWLAHDRLPAVLNSMSIFVNVPLHESFGVSVLEASSCGLPVVASNTGGLPEVVENGRSGILVPVGDVGALTTALNKLLHDKEGREALGRYGRSMVISRYNWSDCLKQMISIYKTEIKT